MTVARERNILRRAGDGNGEIGRQTADLLDRCLCDGVGDRNGNSRFLAAAAVPIVDQGAAVAACRSPLAPKARRPTPGGPKLAAAWEFDPPSQKCM